MQAMILIALIFPRCSLSADTIPINIPPVTVFSPANAEAFPESTIFGDGHFSDALQHLRLVWPPLKLVSPALNNIATKRALWPRSIFMTRIVSPDSSVPWLDGSRRLAILKSCPLGVEWSTSSEEPFVCENEAYVHAFITRATAASDGLCAPHFVPLLHAWKADRVPEVSFTFEGDGIERSQTTLGFSTSRSNAVYMLIERTNAIQRIQSLDGYSALTLSERAEFSRYILFQVAFTLHVLGSLRCEHRDIAMGQMGHNLRYLKLAETQDPCSRAGKSCEWGYCWSAQGSMWCFQRKSAPLIGVIVQLFDFGKGVCKSHNATSWARTHGVLSTTAVKWAVKAAGVPDATLLSRACRYMHLTDCPLEFPAPIDSLQSPYFKRYVVEQAPPGACVMGWNAASAAS